MRVLATILAKNLISMCIVLKEISINIHEVIFFREYLIKEISLLFLGRVCHKDPTPLD